MTVQATFLAYRPLLYAWIGRTIRARYKQSILGGLWALVQPVVVTLIYSGVFTYFVPIDTGKIPYVLFSYTAMVPWTFFSTALVDMVESVVRNRVLVSKIYFPREILPMAALLARLLDLGIAALLLILLLLYFQLSVDWRLLSLLPAVLLTQLALALGLGLTGAAVNVFYRDVRHLVALLLHLWLYATPVIYPMSAVPAWLQPYYQINPMVGVIEAYRAILLYRQIPDISLLISMVVAGIFLLVGYWFFKKVEFQFSDIV